MQAFVITRKGHKPEAVLEGVEIRKQLTEWVKTAEDGHTFKVTCREVKRIDPAALDFGSSDEDTAPPTTPPASEQPGS